jgi:predicted ester cyclase
MRISMLTAVAGLILLAAAIPIAAADVDSNKQLIRDYIQNAINLRLPEAADRYFANDFIEHNPNLPSGISGKKQFITSVLKGFSDYHGEIEDILAEGDEVVTRTRWTGTQDGPFLGRPATGNKVQFATSDFYRIQKNKVVEHWDVVDSLPRAIALGLVPPPSPK